ncbi:uncharacterized protein [Rutidosis leptorrhynchoides]|uniref:uncharacterized protein n=1 Tax=Rutidosis leptorrhynchoides TaxID=125765 RepID=UPI003A98E333
MSTISSSCSFIEHSNLENFLHSVTPIINGVLCAQDGVIQLQANGESKSAHIKLQDIWEIFDEWSACGVDVPVLLENGEKVTQFYIPYLSAIQIFTKKSASSSSGDDNCYIALKCGSSTDDDSNTNSKIVTSNGFNNENGLNNANGLNLGDHNHLYLKYFETCSPYLRLPFMDKIVELGQSYGGLFTFNVNDISPASWMSIAWYPIYHIPAAVYSNNSLTTCFLTFHSLSSSFQDNSEEAGVEKDENEKVLDIVPFGLATYKMQPEVWINPHKNDSEKLKDLGSAASSWLKQLHVNHPDFNFFTRPIMTSGSANEENDCVY